MSDPGLALQKALFEKLSASLTVPVFDAVPTKTPYPYVTLDYEAVDNTTPISGKKRENRLVYLSVWSSYKGQAEVKRIIQPPPTGLRVNCPACSSTMVVPATAMVGKTEINVRCPTESCRKVLTVKLPEQPAATTDLTKTDAPEAAPPRRREPRPEETAD